MAKKYSASFDALIESGRRQLDEMAGKATSGRHAHASDSTTDVGNTVRAAAGRDVPAGRYGRPLSGGAGAPDTDERRRADPVDVIDGTTGGIPFRLTARR